VTRKPTA